MIHHATRKRFSKIVPKLLEWHRINQRSFIWRGLKRSPYVVLVSEFMLQQTGAKQVEKKLPEFLKRFPTVNSLAAATRPEILRAWQGLGYNRRALNLHRAAKEISEQGRFPKKLDELQALPGVGRYTASAILAFAHNADVPVVDVNIERVLSRLWKRMRDVHRILLVREIYELDEIILPKGRSSAWHEALMDLGATICTKNNPKCSICPVRGFCPSSNRIKPLSAKKQGTSEPQHFGQPRRIWRGRILHAIALEETISANELSALLKKKFKIKEVAFVPFVFSLLAVLKEEGFLTISKGVLRFAVDE